MDYILETILFKFKANLCAIKLLHTWKYVDDIYVNCLKARDEAMTTVMKVIIIIKGYVNNNAA